jgi:hypothetical protein
MYVLWRETEVMRQRSEVLTPGFPVKDAYVITIDRLCGLVPSEFRATDPEVRVRFPALPDFLSSESGTGSTQPREYN